MTLLLTDSENLTRFTDLVKIIKEDISMIDLLQTIKSSFYFYTDATNLEECDLLVDIISSISKNLPTRTIVIFPIINEESNPNLLESLFRFVYDKEYPIDNVNISPLILPTNIMDDLEIMERVKSRAIKGSNILIPTIFKNIKESKVALNSLPEGFSYYEKLLKCRLGGLTGAVFYETTDPRLTNTLMHFGRPENDANKEPFNKFKEVKYIYIDKDEGLVSWQTQRLSVHSLLTNEFKYRNKMEDLEDYLLNMPIKELIGFVKNNIWMGYMPLGETSKYMKIILTRLFKYNLECRENTFKELILSVKTNPDTDIEISILDDTDTRAVDKIMVLFYKKIFNDLFYKLITNKVKYDNSNVQPTNCHNLIPIGDFLQNLYKNDLTTYTKMLYKLHGAHSSYFDTLGMLLDEGYMIFRTHNLDPRRKDLIVPPPHMISFEELLDGSFFITPVDYRKNEHAMHLLDTLSNIDFNNICWLADVDHILSEFEERFSNKQELINTISHVFLTDVVNARPTFLIEFLEKIKLILIEFGDKYVSIISLIEEFMSIVHTKLSMPLPSRPEVSVDTYININKVVSVRYSSDDQRFYSNDVVVSEDQISEMIHSLSDARSKHMQYDITERELPIDVQVIEYEGMKSTPSRILLESLFYFHESIKRGKKIMKIFTEGRIK